MSPSRPELPKRAAAPVAAPAAAQPPRPQRKHRFVAVGMVVNWYANGDTFSKPQIAYVEEVGEMALTCRVVLDDTAYLARREGVFHVDEQKSDVIRAESGGWEHTSLTNRLYSEFPKLGMWPEELEAAADKSKAERETGQQIRSGAEAGERTSVV